MAFRNWVSGFFGGQATRQESGQQVNIPFSSAVTTSKPVNEDTALQVSGVWACINLLSNTVAALPLRVYDNSGESKQLVKTGENARLLGRSPNALQTPFNFKQTMMLNYCLHGNAYAWIHRNGRGEPISLNPLPAQQVTPDIQPNGSVVYEFYADAGSELDKHIIAAENMVHVRGMGNGYVGLSTLGHAKPSISSEIATQDFGASYFGGNGKPIGVFTIDQVLDATQRAKFKEMLSGIKDDSQNQKTLLLEAGVKYQKIQLNPDEIQMLESRRYNLEDIARFWGIPSILINDNKNTTSWGSGIEQIIIGWLSTTLNPLLTNWEQELERKLLSGTQKNTHNFNFDVSDLLRADTKGRAEALRSMVVNGMMTPNEARIRLDLPPMPDGDDLYMQGAMLPLAQIKEQAATPAAPAVNPQPSEEINEPEEPEQEENDEEDLVSDSE